MSTGSVLAAEPDCVTIELEIDIAKSAAAAWAKVGAYCDIGEWAGLECILTAGDGGIGTVRVLDGGRATEVMVAADGAVLWLYAASGGRPAVQPLSRFHGSASSQRHHFEDALHPRTLFENMLKNIKALAEAP